MTKTSNETQYRPKAHSKTEKTYLRPIVAGLLGGALLVALLSRTSRYYTCPFVSEHLEAVVHYATTQVIPQQTLPEITVTLDVLRSVAPCNFLVFGLGHDSLMWASLNPGGTTLFLEEEPNWIIKVLNDAPGIRAEAVSYRTQVSEATQLLNRHYRDEPTCWAQNSFLRGNDKCRLALNTLSDNVYGTEWDAIMIDAPRGYFPEAPGRMAAIYLAAVMARQRKKAGTIHVFVHDVDRPVERDYARSFLCEKNLVGAVGKLWHFKIPATTNDTKQFC
ncbi:hypothetical protein STAS_21688 [Striga asiatica]|uniref:Uncharacterized protein n=1 Tax=Striga asiatica TaxID=4170 RepID=A0A5A7QI56_STRAF|nr:hypothetical protein STAS_21688 [Striga asiatica]